jgi:hypothetical protein
MGENTDLPDTKRAEVRDLEHRPALFGCNCWQQGKFSKKLACPFEPFWSMLGPIVASSFVQRVRRHLTPTLEEAVLGPSIILPRI